MKFSKNSKSSILNALPHIMIKKYLPLEKNKNHKSLEKCFEMSLTGEELSSLVSLTEKSQDHSDVAPSLESLSHSFLQEIRFEIWPDLDVREELLFDPLKYIKEVIHVT